MYDDKKKILKNYVIEERMILRLKETAQKFPERKEECEKCIRKAEERRVHIEKAILDIDDKTLSELLYQKYVFGKSLDEICGILNYSRRHIERLQNKALEKIKL